MMKKRSLGLNAFLNGFKSILNLLFPLITFPYVSRILQVRGIGIYNYSSSIVSYFLLIAALGIGTYAVREGAKYRNDKTKISQFASEVFTINIWSTLIAYILLFLCLIVFTNLHDYISCILIFSLQIFFTTLGTEWIYTIYEDYAYITIRSIIFQIISLFFLFIFVRSKNDYLNYAAITVFSSVGSNIFNFLHARSFIKIKLTWKIDWKKHITPIFVIFASNVAIMIFVNSDITLLGIMKNTYVVGLYSVSAKIYAIVKNLLSSLLIVTVPRLALLMGQNRIKEYKEVLSKLTNMMILFTFPAMTGLLMLSKVVILIVSGKSFIKATSSLQILCVALIFSLLGWIISDCVLIPAKREKKVLIGTVVSAILNLVLNLIFIPSLNENAAAISTVIAEATMMIMNMYFSKDMIKNIFISQKFNRNVFEIICGCIGIVIVCLICNMIWSSLIFKTVFSIVLSIIVYVSILLVMKNEIAVSVVEQVMNRIRK